MSWLTALTGTPKVVDTVADTIKSGLNMADKAWYTTQEKSEHSLAMTKVWLEIQKSIASENSIRSITRRILAWGIMGTFLSWVSFACGIYRYDPGWAVHVKNTIANTQLGWLVVSVGIFYFGTYGLAYLKGKKKE